MAIINFAELNWTTYEVMELIAAGDDIPIGGGRTLADDPTNVKGEEYIASIVKRGNRYKAFSKSGEFRQRAAVPGGIYDATNDWFVDPQPFPSWTLNNSNGEWDAPVTYPTITTYTAKDGSTKDWRIVWSEEEVTWGGLKDTVDWDNKPWYWDKIGLQWEEKN